MRIKFLSIFALTTLTLFAVSCSGEKKNETDAETAKTEKTISEEAVKYKVDTANTTVTWKGSKAIGGSHNGTMNVTSGAFAVKDGKLESGNFIIDVASLKVVDIPAEDEGNAKLKGHLLSKDFFDAEKHGSAAFSITAVKEENGKTMIEGNLTLKDVKKNISFPATVTVNGNKAMIVSEVFTIDRTDFGMQYGSSSLADTIKDKAISDDVELSVKLVATKQ
ncbi:Protein YceI [Kordia antarctica]|uniref:Protein YceI n=1 Tax=Kordia antarctica TaxID=1218801 RepID=A0A7L4ZJ19_9FLAO|nr:YceI family protein [Kordia antarctica]QHI36186.1 Protein YceI [Kordia antarctica]